LPDELVELGGVRIEIAGDLVGLFAEIGRPDGLMRFLRVLGLGLVFARGSGKITAPVESFELMPDRGDRLGHDLHAVGPHIGDQTLALAAEIDALVKALGELHCLAGRKPQLA
jgi:hypothetical protein